MVEFSHVTGNIYWKEVLKVLVLLGVSKGILLLPPKLMWLACATHLRTAKLVWLPKKLMCLESHETPLCQPLSYVSWETATIGLCMLSKKIFFSAQIFFQESDQGCYLKKRKSFSRKCFCVTKCGIYLNCEIWVLHHFFEDIRKFVEAYSEYTCFHVYSENAAINFLRSSKKSCRTQIWKLW